MCASMISTQTELSYRSGKWKNLWFLRPTFRMRRVTARSRDSGACTWLVYPFSRQTQGSYHIGSPAIYHTLWDDVLESLREGQPPEQEHLLEELSRQVDKRTAFHT